MAKATGSVKYFQSEAYSPQSAVVNTSETNNHLQQTDSKSELTGSSHRATTA